MEAEIFRRCAGNKSEGRQIHTADESSGRCVRVVLVVGRVRHGDQPVDHGRFADALIRTDRPQHCEVLDGRCFWDRSHRDPFRP